MNIRQIEHHKNFNYNSYTIRIKDKEHLQKVYHILDKEGIVWGAGGRSPLKQIIDTPDIRFINVTEKRMFWCGCDICTDTCKTRVNMKVRPI